MLKLITLLVAALIVTMGVEVATGGQSKSLVGYTVQSVNPTDAKIKKPVNNQWYWLGDKVVIPYAGVWHISYVVQVYSERLDTGTTEAIVSLSASQATATDPGWTRAWRHRYKQLVGSENLQADRTVTVNGPTTLYLIVRESSGSNWGSLQFLGANEAIGTPTTITAESVG